MTDLIPLKQTCNKIRREIIEMVYRTGNTGAHLGGSLSMVEILVALYSNFVTYDPKNPNSESRDRVILSKGHAALALYPVLAEYGIIEQELLQTFKQNGSKLGGHPSLNGLSGIEFSSGSLGQGLSYGVGVGLALKRKSNYSSKVYVILGDGECDEGSVWESAMSASHYNLNNLIAIIDVNKIQYDGDTNSVMALEPFKEKWEYFGWEAHVVDGHDLNELIKMLEYSQKIKKPIVILAETIKGKGISFMENNPKYHNAFLTQKMYEDAMNELEKI